MDVPIKLQVSPNLENPIKTKMIDPKKIDI